VNPTSSRNLAADVFNTLKERIYRWEYSPGHRFTEEAVCAEFGMSRSPVREALGMLVENGLVEKIPYRGYTVKQPDMQTIYELYDVRLALELFVIGHLAKNGMPQETWTQLHTAWSSIPQDAPQESGPDYPRWDEEFHENLAMATNNQTLVQTLRAINERLHFIRIYDITTSERLQLTVEQHLRILQCIQLHDSACAQEALTINIMDGRKHAELAVRDAIARAYLGI